MSTLLERAKQQYVGKRVVGKSNSDHPGEPGIVVDVQLSIADSVILLARMGNHDYLSSMFLWEVEVQ